MRRDKWARLLITDGTEVFDLLNNPVFLKNWEPTIAQKREIRQQSFQADGSYPVDFSWENIIDVFTLNMRGKDGDFLYKQLGDLHQLLLKGVYYWATKWQKTPVWIEARAQHETYTRYAQVVSFQTEKDNNPFAQPFFGKRPYRKDFDLGIEHTHWSKNYPGDSTCVQTSGQQDFVSVTPLAFSGGTTDQDLDLGNPAQLQDLPDGGLIWLDGWIKADTAGEGNEGRIAVKGSADLNTRGWHFYLTSSLQLKARIIAVGIGQSTSFETLTAGHDHHVVMVYDETGDRKIYFAIDGVWCTYAGQTASVGAYTVDNADDCIVGNNSANGAEFDGNIGWLRIADSALYTVGVDFNPPSQCSMPGQEGSPVWLGIREGEGTTITDLSGNANDGTAANDEWGDACTITFGRAATCLDEVYVANKHNQAQLTHIFVDDGGVFGPNLVGAVLPFNLLPANPANNDAVYFGIDTVNVDDSGPFCSLVFDIGTAATFGAGDDITWQYWNGGGWVALTVQDNTDTDGAMTGNPLDTTGVNSVHWEQPPAWATTAVNGVTGYWVRGLVTEVTGVTTATQQNRDVYSILWPYVDIDEAQVPGDIEALAEHILTNQSAGWSGGGSATLFGSRILIGLRSISRGADFTPYINISDEQNNAGITVSLGVFGAFANNVETPTGRQATFTNTTAAWWPSVHIDLDATLAPQYRGKFHVYIRGEQTSGASGDITARFDVGLGDLTGYGASSSKTATFSAVGTDDMILDLGTVKIPPTDMLSDDDESLVRLQILLYGDGAADCNLYDVILMPVDEWFGEFKDIEDSNSWSGDTLLDVDGVGYPKDQKRALLRIASTDYVQDIYKPRAFVPFLQENADQRLWFLVVHDDSGDDLSEFEIAGSVQENCNARYLGARGDR